MAEVTIGGETIQVSLPNFKAVKAAWQYVTAAIESGGDPMKSVDAVLGIVSVGGDPKFTVDELEEKLLPAEMLSLRPFVNTILVEIGLASGEAKPAEEGAESPSTATSTPSSSTSSEPSDQPTGMA